MFLSFLYSIIYICIFYDEVGFVSNERLWFILVIALKFVKR